MDCTFADDSYLVAAFPGVVKTVPERWLVTVDGAAEGLYTVTMAAVGYQLEAGLGDGVGAIRDGLLVALAGQMSAAVSSSGVASLVLDATSSASLGVAVAGPAPDAISASLVSGGDGNAAGRAFWLERAKCWLPPCCVITCASDYTLMHAALAAHYIDKFAGGASTGSAMLGPYKSMRLGPASLEAAAKSWASGNPADGDLDAGGPGSLYLAIRARYIFGVRCG